METNFNGADQENAPQTVGRQTRGTFEIKHPLYSKRRPKPQVPDSTREVWELGLVPRPTSGSCMEFALTKHKGRVRFRFTEVGANGQRHRFHLDPSELLATVSAIHKGRSIMGAGA